MNMLLGLLGTAPAPLLMLLIGLVVAAESGLAVGVVLPGVSGLLSLGFLAHLYVVGLGPALATGACAALTGTTAGYLSGRHLGLRSRLSLAAAARVPASVLRGPTISAAQWLVGARTFTPRLAGARGWSYPSFASWSLPSALAWGTGMVAAGWAAGQSYAALRDWFGIGGGIAVGGLVLALLLARHIRFPVRHTASPCRRAYRIALTRAGTKTEMSLTVPQPDTTS